MLHNEQQFSNLMTTYMHRAEGAADIRAGFDRWYMEDLDEWLWYSHPACRAATDKKYEDVLRLGVIPNTVELLKRKLATNAGNSAGFDANMIMAKIAYHRTAIRNLDRTIADAQHTSPPQHMLIQQQFGAQVPTVVGTTDLEIMIKYRDIHRWCVCMLNTEITSRTRSTDGM